MKNKSAAALLLGLLAGCAAPPRPERPQRAEEVRGAADALRVEHEYRPAPTGGEMLAIGYDCAPKVYYAQCWGGYSYTSYRSYGSYGYRGRGYGRPSRCD